MLKRSTKIILIVIILLVLAAAGLFIAAKVQQAKKSSEVSSQSSQVFPASVPTQLNDQQKSDIADIAKLFLESFGTYNETTNLKNFNSAAGYATKALRIELYQYADKIRAKQVFPLTPIIVETKTKVTNIETATDQAGNPRILAHVEGTIITTKNDLTTDQDFSGSLSMIAHGKFWFVDDMDITPDFLGFK